MVGEKEITGGIKEELCCLCYVPVRECACMHERGERELLLLIDCSAVLGVEKGEQVLICSVEREQ